MSNPICLESVVLYWWSWFAGIIIIFGLSWMNLSTPAICSTTHWVDHVTNKTGLEPYCNVNPSRFDATFWIRVSTKWLFYWIPPSAFSHWLKHTEVKKTKIPHSCVEMCVSVPGNSQMMCNWFIEKQPLLFNNHTWWFYSIPRQGVCNIHCVYKGAASHARASLLNKKNCTISTCLLTPQRVWKCDLNPGTYIQHLPPPPPPPPFLPSTESRSPLWNFNVSSDPIYHSMFWRKPHVQRERSCRGHIGSVKMQQRRA